MLQPELLEITLYESDGGVDYLLDTQILGDPSDDTVRSALSDLYKLVHTTSKATVLDADFKGKNLHLRANPDQIDEQSKDIVKWYRGL